MTKRSAIALWLPSWSKLTILPWVSHFFNLSHDKTPNLMVYSEISFWNELFLCSIKKDCCWIVTDSPHVKAENRKQCTTPSARDFVTVLSDSPGLRGFCFGLVVFVLNLPNGQVLFFGEIQITEGLKSILLIKKGFGASWNDLLASTC